MNNHPANGPWPAVRKYKTPAEPNCEQALRLCEDAAMRVKAASEELAACWTALGRDVNTGVDPTELLRRRAWCNVLELRLKERAHALEAARHGVDAIWQEAMISTHGCKPSEQIKISEENLFSRSWALLSQSRLGSTIRARIPAARR
jgi:hypothetical protein